MEKSLYDSAWKRLEQALSKLESNMEAFLARPLRAGETQADDTRENDALRSELQESRNRNQEAARHVHAAMEHIKNLSDEETGNNDQ